MVSMLSRISPPAQSSDRNHRRPATTHKRRLTSTFRLTVAPAVLCAVAATAQTIDPEMKKAQQARLAALGAGDDQTWGRYTTDDFVGVGFGGRTQTKVSRMAEIKGTKWTPPPGSSEETFRVYGETVIRTLRTSGAQGPTRLI